MFIDLDEINERTPKRDYSIELDGQTYAFRFDVETIDKIERGTGLAIHVLYLSLLDPTKTYRNLLTMISHAIEVPDLANRLSLNARNIRELDDLCAQLAQDNPNPSFIEAYMKRRAMQMEADAEAHRNDVKALDFFNSKGGASV